MENSNNQKCHFGQHISVMEKERLIQLILNVSSNETYESLSHFENKELVEKYKAIGMEKALEQEQAVF